jgi:hypothetical protein
MVDYYGVACGPGFTLIRAQALGAGWYPLLSNAVTLIPSLGRAGRGLIKAVWKGGQAPPCHYTHNREGIKLSSPSLRSREGRPAKRSRGESPGRRQTHHFHVNFPFRYLTTSLICIFAVLYSWQFEVSSWHSRHKLQTAHCLLQTEKRCLLIK